MVRDSTIQKLTEALRDIGEASVAELAVLVSVSSETARKAMIELEESDSHIKSEMRSGCKYYRWTDNIPSGIKNASGATDMTQYQAMVNTIYEDSKLTDGAVYATNQYEGVVGEPGFVLVLSAYKDFAVGLSVCETSFKYFDATNAVVFSEKGREYYVDPRRVVTVSMKKFGDCQWFMDTETYQYIKGKVGEMLKISTVTKAGAIAYLQGSGWMKIHDDAVYEQAKKLLGNMKTAEPIAVVPETQQDIEWWKREAEIWKEAFYAVCHR